MEPGLTANRFPPKPLFSKDRKQAEEKTGTAPAPKKFKLGYPVLVFALALIVLAVFVKLNIVEPKTENSRAAAVKKPDFVLSYQRTKTEPGNIFRFALTVENDTAFFTLDDLKYGRHFQKTIPSVPARATRDLRDAILATDFMKLQQDPEDVVTKDVDETRTLTIVQNNRQNTITVRNNFAKSSFEAIERAIDRFSDDNGLISVSMNVEEMKKYADLTFRKAEDLYKSYQAKPENLRQAISRYKLSMEYFEQFSPKPPEWDEARKHLAEAEQTFEKLRRDLEFNIQQFYKLRDYARASAECQKAMDLLGPDSKAYPKLKTYKLEFDRQLRKTGPPEKIFSFRHPFRIRPAARRMRRKKTGRSARGAPYQHKTAGRGSCASRQAAGQNTVRLPHSRRNPSAQTLQTRL